MSEQLQRRESVSDRVRALVPKARELCPGLELTDQRMMAAAMLDGLIDEDLLKKAGQATMSSGVPFDQVLEDERIVLDPERLARIRAYAAGLHYDDISDIGISDAVRGILPAEIAHHHRAIPVSAHDVRFDDETGDFTGGGVVFALGAPNRAAEAKAALSALMDPHGTACTFVAASPEKIDEILRARFALTTFGDDPEEEEATEEEDLRARAEDGEANRYWKAALAWAVGNGASDLHFDTNARTGVVEARARIDNVLIRFDRDLSRKFGRALFMILKSHFGMNEQEKFTPKSGGSSGVKVANRIVDLRGEWAPLNGRDRGETFIVRIFDKGATIRDLVGLGFSETNVEKITRALERPYGCVIACGPTGSGKSSTLYAGLRMLVSDQRRIITIEDPIESEIEGVRQIQVDTRATPPLTFQLGLRSALRQDPNVLMVGEIRDGETAEVSMRGAQTGHMLLSTIHCNEAADAPIKLIEMGVKPFVVADALTCVIAQRLVRTLCSHCREPYVPSLGEVAAMGYDPETAREIVAAGDAGDLHFHRPRPGGCGRCTRQGFRGRTSVAEVLVINDRVRSVLLSDNPTADAVREAGLPVGERFMDDAFAKIFAGTTTYDEVKAQVALDSLDDF